MMDDPGLWRYRPNAPAPGTLLGPIADIPVGTAREYRFGRGRSAFSMFVVHIPDGGVRAYLNLCPHYSLPLNHAPDEFMQSSAILCSQHFALFRADTGACFSGACEGRSLTAIPVGVSGQGLLTIAD
ncbi:MULTISPECIES: Rieske 2Fe-2S domain-containing protein [unclassified Novosphingobium]|uniref:Rieske (2Fe-2S) protein n=1 Tax=unclassified Novosphingobium TaxID=2644732 RepID=UPI000B0E226E|nr:MULTISPECIES: Rieske 2Fe-2S domain-containing protein [unclassified Novosphingobium]MBB3360499.1 nitrite reductase/ring-hydroxylating ferredoxin subunit [Novosphingobium sp. BK256]MBB3376881.1 nitrite reductase/ring-hydroxylating ferredoxin subunit [Novosphingobium sp. BK280]MBB3381245.1 nitrite reductase/ring-hydroxylating ferredoxin subunit [Novosphingobium sp. BK258]MBB3422943.1 nitrite reductase/ring-hydroxylating ferredoxin subunit [Novosphingobium sp. BK267]MBB3451645.1 nitrite reduct